MPASDFRNYDVSAPAYDEVAAQYDALQQRLDAAAEPSAWIEIVTAWDQLRRQLYDWHAVVEIRFHQDTQNSQFKEAKEFCDQLQPKLTDLAVRMKRKLLAPPYRQAVADALGDHLLNLWECDIASFDPVIEADLVRQSELEAQHTERLAAARFSYRGQTLTLSELQKFAEDPDREVRHQAAKMRSDWFADNQEDLDGIYDQLVQLRHGMGTKLGYDDFIPLGYKLMHRVDYGQADVEIFRKQVRDHVVPLCEELKTRQAQRLGIEPLMAWDEALHDRHGNPAPQGDHDWMIVQAQQMFGEMGGGMDELFRQMCRRGLLDLKSRAGKAGGGFCDGLPIFGMPFIYANFNGTKGDVEVFTHEMGHAFQNYSSRHHDVVDYFWPTSESAEIHSMGLEYLTWPYMEMFFGDDAERFRQVHLTGGIQFLPYGVAVDHFQHLVYERPQASPDERCAMWQEMERMYLPWRQYGDLPHEASGRRWQSQLHIYVHPFYYIDYTLALTCALQLWLRARHDRDAAFDTYLALCGRGGEAPFGELIESASLRSPFADGCLADVVAHAREVLQP